MNFAAQVSDAYRTAVRIFGTLAARGHAALACKFAERDVEMQTTTSCGGVAFLGRLSCATELVHSAARSALECPFKPLIFQAVWCVGGERGIRTPDRALRPYNGLANRRLQPLGHLSAVSDLRHGVCAPTP